MDNYKRLKPLEKGLLTGLVEINTSHKSSVERVKYFYPTNFYGVVQVLDKSDRDKLVVRFLENDATREVSLHNLRKGKCRNETLPKRSSVVISTNFEDKIYSNKSGCEFRILSRKGGDCEVEFLKTGTRLKALVANARKGKITDYFHKSVYGVGFLGIRDDVSVRFKKEYTLWHNMLKRAYCKEDKKGYFGRAFVDPRWHSFANFLEDIKGLHNYDLWVLGQVNSGHTKYNLDKDFSFIGCNTYSKDTCQFITEHLNKGTTRKTSDAVERLEKYKAEMKCQK